jgi:hypothetical protein
MKFKNNSKFKMWHSGIAHNPKEGAICLCVHAYRAVRIKSIDIFSREIISLFLWKK